MTMISNCTASALKDAAASLVAGNLVSFPTETVYGLGADASNQQAVARIYEVKGRPTGHPLIVHISSINYLDKWAEDIPDYAIELARAFWPGPMTLILPRKDLAKDFITGGQDNVGIRVPAHTIAQSLLKEFEAKGGTGVAAPSANRFGKVSPTNSQAVYDELGKYLSKSDQILDGGQSEVGIESTIIDCTESVPVILRPGFITIEMMENLGIVKVREVKGESTSVKSPGLLEAHYSPNAQVKLNGDAQPGDGFIALAHVQTPIGAIRLASPKNENDYAHLLYGALRLADTKGIKVVQVIPPVAKGLGIAIINRLAKASYHI